MSLCQPSSVWDPLDFYTQLSPRQSVSRNPRGLSRHHPAAYTALLSTGIILKDWTLLSVRTECAASYSGLLTNLLMPMVPMKKTEYVIRGTPYPGS